MQDFIGNLLQRIDASGANFSQQAYGVVSHEIMPLLQALFIAYVAWYGFQLFTGAAKISVGDVVSRVVRMLVILALVSQWSTFNALVYAWMTQTPEDIGRAILAASSTGITEPTNGLSMIWNTANRAAAAFSEQAGYFSVLPAIISGIIMVATGLFVGVALAILILAKVMMWVLIGTAPIFIACWLFERTRSYGQGWFNQVLLYALIPLFVYVVAAFLIAAMDPELTRINAKTQTRTLQLSDFAAFILLCGAGSFVLIQIQMLAQGIVGGIAAGIGRTVQLLTGLGIGQSLAGSRGTAGAIGREGMQNRTRTIEGMRSNIRSASAEAMQNRITSNSVPK